MGQRNFLGSREVSKHILRHWRICLGLCAYIRWICFAVYPYGEDLAELDPLAYDAVLAVDHIHNPCILHERSIYNTTIFYKYLLRVCHSQGLVRTARQTNSARQHQWAQIRHH
jgi:hypothetical protein